MKADELVLRAKQGDKEALIDLVMSRKDDYFRLALVHTGNPEDAMDALQEMIILVFTKIKGLHNDTAFFAWSITILLNCCRRITRKKTRVSWLSEVQEKAFPSSNQVEEQIDLVMALGKLSPPQSEAVKLKYLIDMDYETMSQVLKIPVGTAKSRVFNGLRNLKIILGGNQDE